MLGAEKYKRFAVDCIRIAETLSGEDQQRLLKIADVWTERALNSKRPSQAVRVTCKHLTMMQPGPNSRYRMGEAASSSRHSAAWHSVLRQRRSNTSAYDPKRTWNVSTVSGRPALI